jgi:hypothetical protein
MSNARGLLLTAFCTALLAGPTGGAGATTPAVHALVEVNEQCVLGGTRNRQWVNAQTFEKAIKQPLEANVYTLAGLAGKYSLSRNPESECHQQWLLSGFSGNDGIAVESPDWNVMPRIPRFIDLKDTTYVKVVRDALVSAGLKNPDVKLTQAFKIDLDGDGQDEVVIAANRFAAGAGAQSGIAHIAYPGDYTLVLVRKIVGKAVKNIFVVKAVWLSDNGGGLPRANHISAIADLNGDGVMEVVVNNAYYEGSGSDVIEFSGARSRDVLSCGCDH